MPQRLRRLAEAGVHKEDLLSYSVSSKPARKLSEPLSQNRKLKKKKKATLSSENLQLYKAGLEVPTDPFYSP